MSVVLLIDNEPRMATLVEMVVGDLRARVVLAVDLAEALEAARRDPPDVVLLDLALGKEDGLAILPRLREETTLSSVPVVAFSVHDSREDEARARGVVDFVKKPFRSEDLRRAVAQHLQGPDA